MTGGSETQAVAQFNPALGTLTSVQIIINGTLTSDIKVENLDGAASNVSAQVNGVLSLQGPGFSPLTVDPSLSENTALSAYDGVLDFGGTSGHDFGDQSAQASQSTTLTSNLSAWIGTGTVNLTESAQASSTVSGSGNQVSSLTSNGSGNVQVIYSYTPATPNVPPTPPPMPSGCGCDADRPRLAERQGVLRREQCRSYHSGRRRRAGRAGEPERHHCHRPDR